MAMNNHEILFDWDGQPVKKTLEELAEQKSDDAGNRRYGR